MSREVKLGEMLELLIARDGYHRNRKKILEEVGVSAAALSQYIHGQSRPGLQTLVALADFFNVTLDYLVFGDPVTAGVDFGPLARFVDLGLADVQARTARHSALVGRIGRVVADEVDRVARQVAGGAVTPRGGFITEDECLRLERHCTRADILTVDLAADIRVSQGAPDAPGRFMPVVAENLGRGVAYRFLLTSAYGASDDLAGRFRALLGSYAGGDLVRENCQIRRAVSPVICGAGLVRIDLESLGRGDPQLLAQVADYIDSQGWFGYVLRPNDDFSGDSILKPSHIADARRAFEQLWSAGAKI